MRQLLQGKMDPGIVSSIKFEHSLTQMTSAPFILLSYSSIDLFEKNSLKEYYFLLQSIV